VLEKNATKHEGTKLHKAENQLQNTILSTLVAAIFSQLIGQAFATAYTALPFRQSTDTLRGDHQKAATAI
jgi:hypothetical protein